MKQIPKFTIHSLPPSTNVPPLIFTTVANKNLGKTVPISRFVPIEYRAGNPEFHQIPAY